MDEVFGKDKAERGLEEEWCGVLRCGVGGFGRTDLQVSAIRVIVECPINRAFRVEHWYYDQQRIDGWDYDIGAQRVRTATAVNVAGPPELITAWGLHPTDFHPWNTADPWVRGSGPCGPTAISTARQGAA